MSANKRDARLKNLELARIRTETERVRKESADADDEMEALEREISKVDEELKRVESSSIQANFKNNRALNCRNCRQKVNTTTRKPVATKCRHTICLPCFWQRYIESRDNNRRLNPRRKRVPVTFPCCRQHTNMPYQLTEQQVPKSHTTVVILEICEAE